MPRLFLFVILLGVLVVSIVCLIRFFRNRKKTLKAGRPLGLCVDCAYSELCPTGQLECWSPLFEENGASAHPVSKPCTEVRNTQYCAFKPKRREVA
jgi:hypothetical protein